jgi:hypothetical protein
MPFFPVGKGITLYPAFAPFLLDPSNVGETGQLRVRPRDGELSHFLREQAASCAICARAGSSRIVCWRNAGLPRPRGCGLFAPA